MPEILGHGPLTPEMASSDTAKVLSACAAWASEREIMRATGLGKGRVSRVLELSGDLLERMVQRRNTCTQRWIWRRRTAD